MKTMKTKAILTAVLATALLTVPGTALGQTDTDRGVRVTKAAGESTDTKVTKVTVSTSTSTQDTNNPTAGQIITAKEGRNVTVVTAAPPANKVAKVKVTKITDIGVNGVTVAGDGSVNYGATTTLTVTVDPVFTDSKTVTWASSTAGKVNFSNATQIGTNGQATVTVSGTGAGSTNITATVGGVASTAKAMTVNKVAATLTCTNTAVSFAQSDALNSTKTKTGVSVTGGTISVSSSDANKVTASYANGTITLTRKSEDAFSGVTITVSVTPDDNHTAPSNVTFNVSGTACYVAVTGVTLSSTALTNGVADISIASTNNSFNITATVEPSGATNKTVSWSQSSSNGGEVLFGSSSGTTTTTSTSGNSVTIYGHTVGSVTVTATATDGKTATFTVNVWNNITTITSGNPTIGNQGKWLVKGAATTVSTSFYINAADVEVTFRDVSMTGTSENGPIDCGAHSGIVLNFEGTNTISATNTNKPGIKCAQNNETTINVKSGTTTVTGGSGAAGIGTGSSQLSDAGRSCGNIVVNLSNSAALNAYGGVNGPGIGAGDASNNSSSCGNITINAPSGTTLQAVAGTGFAAGIGCAEGKSSYKSRCGTITITTNGGSTNGTTKPNVIATGGSSAQGDIGRGYNTGASCPGICIKGPNGNQLMTVETSESGNTEYISRNAQGTTNAKYSVGE